MPGLRRLAAAHAARERKLVASHMVRAQLLAAARATWLGSGSMRLQQVVPEAAWPTAAVDSGGEESWFFRVSLRARDLQAVGVVGGRPVGDSTAAGQQPQE